MSLYLEIGSFRGNQVQTRSFGWALIQSNWCPYKKGKFGHKRKTNTEVRLWRDIGRCPSTYKPRNTWSCQKWGERPGSDLPLVPSEGAWGCRCPDFGLLASRTVRLSCCAVLSQPVCGNLLQQPQGTNRPPLSKLLKFVPSLFGGTVRFFSMCILNF